MEKPLSDSLPLLFVEQMKILLAEDLGNFLQSLDQKPPVSLRLNPFKPGAHFENSTPIPWCKNGLFLPERPRFVMDPLIHAGAYYVQEASSMLIASACPFKPAIKILDMCASPGGKSTLLASFMDEDSLLVSNELVGNRAIVLRDNLCRWAYPNVIVTCNRHEDFRSLNDFFDVVVVDAPCSGEGMFRKDQDVVAHWSPKNIQQCVARQRDILESALHCLKPGGTLIYSTCTYNREENEDNVNWLFETYSDSISMIEPDFDESWGLTKSYDAELKNAFHCFQHRFKGEGFFISLIQKTRELQRIFSHKKSKATAFSKPKFPIAGEWVQHSDSYSFAQLKNEITAMPNAVAAHAEWFTDHFFVLKAGVTVGEWKGKDFIPSHDLALSQIAASTIPRYELSLEDAIRYLRKDSISIPNTNGQGWALVTYKKLELGWVKVLPNRINIHLPKELKIRVEF